jgi:3-methyl-2-oxobutanoate hydroxymethyltransferase
MIKTNRPTVADLRACKGMRRLTQVLVQSIDEASAAAAASIDMVSVDETGWSSVYRQAMPDTFVTVGLLYGNHATIDDYLRAAFAAIRIGADAVYCAASLEVVRRLFSEGIPVVGHVGLIPAKRTWTGGYKAVGKTAASALEVLNQTRRLEEAGAFAAEIEVVPQRVAAEICSRTSLIMLSMGSGAQCDCQYLFAEDILGYNPGHYPRHSARYRNFTSEYARLQTERVAAFREFRSDVENGRYPAAGQCVNITDDEFSSFVRELQGRQEIR